MTTQTRETFAPPLPAWLRLGLRVLSGVVALSAVGMALASLVIAPNAVWVMFGFEVVVALAGVVGVVAAGGRFDSGQGLVWLCVAGVLFVAGVLSYLGTPQGIVWSQGTPASPTTTWSVGRVALAGVFGAAAVYAVLRRSAEARRNFARGLVAGVLLVCLMGGLVIFGGRAMAALAGTAGVVKAAIAIVVGFIGITLMSAAGHWLIRAFECARREDATPTPAARPS
ncbi:MAG: hypothetical protein SFY69_06420 [Planctomycetota bacterium]|nr:hypothetical protein [Planctomycetota bacterium]